MQDYLNDQELRFRELEARLEEAEQLINAIKSGEVDAFAILKEGKQEIYTLESSDYTYRLLIEESNEGAININNDGLILYTNRYLIQLLGLQYTEVIGHNLRKFISSDSSDVFEEMFTASLKGSSKGEVILKGKDRLIPVYMSMTSLEPKLSTIGIIITDLTEKKEQENLILSYQRNLEIKNSSLGKMNNELQSFAHISSHDLQEPVRKIQMIASRIIESEFDNLSENGRDLLRRMQKSAKRMFLLINDLLAYSTTLYESSLESVNLEELVEDVAEDFLEELEKDHLRIQTHDLRDVNVVPLHFRQVLHNLFSNSMKFAKPGIVPEVSISCSSISGSQIENLKLDSNTDYCLIKYSDNGIGFDPVYNEKIFGLFQRLHPKEKYNGTGIGLAIVKKIVENHNGVIIAKGSPGKGAEFNIYLPSSK